MTTEIIRNLLYQIKIENLTLESSPFQVVSGQDDGVKLTMVSGAFEDGVRNYLSIYCGNRFTASLFRNLISDV